MPEKIKIGIYSGKVPSTTFIENLINGLSNFYIVHIYGKQNSSIQYHSKNIKLFLIPKSKSLRFFYFIKNLCFALTFRTEKLLSYFKKIKNFSLREMYLNLETVLPIMINPPDILHFQWISPMLKIENFNGDFKKVLSLRGSQINMNPISSKNIADTYVRVFKNIDAFHSVSDDIKKLSRNYIKNTKPVKVIKPAVDEIYLKFSNKYWRYDFNEKFKIISVGTNRWKKGFTYSLDSMRLLADKKIKFSYTIIAPGEDRENIDYQISDLNLRSYVNYIPGLAHEQTLKEIKCCHLFLLPSLSEGIANVVLESMALGVPVLSTNCGGMSEVITDEVNGFLVPPRKPQIVSTRINDIISYDKEYMLKIINAAKSTVIKNHLSNNQISAFKNLYNEILNE